ncbi:MAG: response regulator, partial [Anaerolineaceae bacterium]|nr:response regulator [Anaerolineaceae bacterium]
MLPVNPIKVVIADDHPFVRIGIRKILESTPGFVVIGESQNGQEALQLATELLPDVLLL